MRETQKYKLNELFKLVYDDIKYDAKLTMENSTTFIDGGYLLLHVNLRQSVMFSDICTSYITYVKRCYGSRVVVFDGYGKTATRTIVAERQRMSVLQQYIYLVVSEDMAASVI
ncbi:hypothetical protein PR048_005135 [Dryococelus australis]|uniref:Uncharacterized protein n=1 Tax=Dryococelus australis TaxID=614101 RepID=A0ABQ9I8F4_9NEOP|nr:hypothetical protein PR048_005135 [Dryococelus australis]